MGVAVGLTVLAIAVILLFAFVVIANIAEAQLRIDNHDSERSKLGSVVCRPEVSREKRLAEFAYVASEEARLDFVYRLRHGITRH